MTDAQILTGGAIGGISREHAQQRAPVGDMLEHLHGHDAIKGPIGRKCVHVGRDDGEIGQSFGCGARCYVLALRLRVRYRKDARGRIAPRHP